MRIGVIADVHGNDTALNVVLKKAVEEGAERFLFAGDLCGYFPFVNECVTLLSQFDVTGVRGNHDQVALDCLDRNGLTDQSYRDVYGKALDRTLAGMTSETRSWLQNLAPTRSLESDGRQIRLVHGTPWDLLNGRVYPDFAKWERLDSGAQDLLVMAHTHYPLLREFSGRLVANPGSVGQPRHRSGAIAAYAIYDSANHQFSLREVRYDARGIVCDCLENQPHMRKIVRRFLS